MVKSSVLYLETLLDQQAEPFMRLLTESLQEVLEGQMTEFVGAAAGERSKTRTGRRAGHHSRSLATRSGQLELRVPRDRDRRFSTELLDRFPRSEKAFISALGQTVVLGWSTAKVKAVSEELCGHAFSASTLSQIKKGLDDALARFARRVLEEPYPRLILQARRERVCIDGVIRSQVVLMAIGINREGRRQMLGVELANRVSRTGWKAFQRRLKQRGLHGVEFVAGDDGDALNKAVRETGIQRRLAPLRGALPARRAAQPGIVPASGPGTAHQELRDTTGGEPIQQHESARGAAEGRPEERRPVDPASGSLADGHDSAEVANLGAVSRLAVARTDWTPRTTPKLGDGRTVALNGHRSRASKVLAGLAGTLVAAGFFFWGAGLIVDWPEEPVSAPEESVSAPTAFDAAPRHADHGRFLDPPAPVTPRQLPAPPTRSRFQLSGVVAAKKAHGPGIALIGIDGGSARVFRVGEPVDGDLVLKAVTWDGASLGPARGPAIVILEVVAAATPSRPVSQAADWEQRWLAAFPPVPGDAGPTQPAPADAGNMLPMPVAVGDVQPTTAAADGTLPTPAANLAPDALPVGQASSSPLSPGRRYRLRTLDASR